MAVLGAPFLITTTLPDVAFTGTATRIDVSDQLVTGAAIPLKATKELPELPCPDPKFVPVSVTAVPY